MNEYIRIALFGIAVLICGYDLIIEGIKNIFKLNFEENSLMAIAIIAAFALGEYPECLAVILLYKIGEYLEEKASKTSNDEIEKISKIKSDTANIICNNETKEIESKELKIGDMILIKPGEKVPVDAIIVKGKSNFDTSSITGESKSKSIGEKNEILSGYINLTSAVECEVIRDYEHSTASEIVDLVYQAKNNKGKTENFINKFSKIYTPIVIILAFVIALLPPIVLKDDFTTWINKGLVFLVASCPCSLVISVPLAFFTCLGNISKKGMIIKGSKHIEKISKVTSICFDKTGTLTTGEMGVNRIQDIGIYNRDEILEYIYSLEKLSNHPIAKAIVKELSGVKEKRVEDYREIAGMGLCGTIDGKKVVLGNEKLLKKFNISYDNLKEGAIYLGIEKKLAGYILIEEKIRNNISDITGKFGKEGIKKLSILTGDNSKSANEIAQKLGINEVYSNLLPKDKLEKLNEKKNKKEIVAFVGDGINDSPVLATADFGIAMGNGTEIANSSADGILLSNNIMTIPEIIKVAKKSMVVAKTNIVFSILVKLIVLSLGVFGYAPIWLAVLADTGVTAITVLNSMRILKF